MYEDGSIRLNNKTLEKMAFYLDRNKVLIAAGMMKDQEKFKSQKGGKI